MIISKVPDRTIIFGKIMMYLAMIWFFMIVGSYALELSVLTDFILTILLIVFFFFSNTALILTYEKWLKKYPFNGLFYALFGTGIGYFLSLLIAWGFGPTEMLLLRKLLAVIGLVFFISGITSCIIRKSIIGWQGFAIFIFSLIFTLTIEKQTSPWLNEYELPFQAIVTMLISIYPIYQFKKLNSLKNPPRYPLQVAIKLYFKGVDYISTNMPP